MDYITEDSFNGGPNNNVPDPRRLFAGDVFTVLYHTFIASHRDQYTYSDISLASSAGLAAESRLNFLEWKYFLKQRDHPRLGTMVRIASGDLVTTILENRFDIDLDIDSVHALDCRETFYLQRTGLNTDIQRVFPSLGSGFLQRRFLSEVICNKQDEFLPKYIEELNVKARFYCSD